MIPVCVPSVGEKELAYVTDCLKTNWISSKGKYVTAFEERFSEYCGVSHGIATINGTAALHLALAAAGVQEGDEVILPSFTMISTAFAVLYCGATPVVVDAMPDTWTMDPDQVGEKVTERTKVILPVHIYGHPCDMDPVMRVAREHDLVVVEDAAEAHGALYRGKKAGGIGHVGCFSFYANKIITTGEGGMVVTDDEEMAARARSLKDLAFDPERRFLHGAVGFNYRMTNIQAAIGLAQMEKIDEFVAKRRDHAASYTRRLRDIPGLTLPVEKPWARNVFWMYGMLVGDALGMSRDELAERLSDEGIETRLFFHPMHTQPVFRERGLFAGERCPVSETLGARGLYLPSSSGLTEEEIGFICRAVRDISTGEKE